MKDKGPAGQVLYDDKIIAIKREYATKRPHEGKAILTVGVNDCRSPR